MRFTTVDVSAPTTGSIVYTDRWWVCLNGDPRTAVMDQGWIPFCNPIKWIVESLASICNEDPDVMHTSKAIYLRYAYVPSECKKKRNRSYITISEAYDCLRQDERGLVDILAKCLILKNKNRSALDALDRLLDALLRTKKKVSLKDLWPESFT